MAGLSEESSGSILSMDNACQVSIIIVTYNSASVFPGLLQSLVSHPPQLPWELIVVDNSSDDQSVNIVCKSFPDATIIRNCDNTGFATAVNRGAECAHGVWLLLLNPDLSWSNDFVGPLVEFMVEHPKAAAVVPRLVDANGETQLSLRRFPTHANIWLSRGSPLYRWPILRRYFDAYNMADPESTTCVEAAAASCMLIRPEAFAEARGMDVEYRLYVEDTDLCKRWFDIGWQVWMVPKVVVTHQWTDFHHRAIGRKGHHRDSIRRYFRKYYAEKPWRNALVFTALRLAGWWDCVTERLLHSKDSGR